MSPFSILAAALLSAQPVALDAPVSPPPIEPLPEQGPQPAPEQGRDTVAEPLSGRPHDHALIVAAGVTAFRYDDIPVTAATLHLGGTFLSGPPAPGVTRLGFSLGLELTAGETENGLRTSGAAFGPEILAVLDRLRLGAGIKLGLYSLRRITSGFTEEVLIAMVRGSADFDLWRGKSAVFHATATGTLGTAFGARLRGVGLLLGVRL